MSKHEGATDVTAFVEDLDGGNLERKLGVSWASSCLTSPRQSWITRNRARSTSS